MVATYGSIRESRGDRIFLGFVFAFLTLVLVAITYPLIFIVSSSFSSGQAVGAGKVWLLPVEPTLVGYETVFRHSTILLGYVNSAVYTVFGTLINIIVTVLVAYPLSRKDFFGGKFIVLALVFTMMFAGGLIPLYLTVRRVGILNTRLAMLIPQALHVWQVIVARTFFASTIPDELAEAAEMDGCSDANFLWRVVLPLSKPVIAVLVLLYAVFHWNAYFDALMYLNNPRLFPLQIVLRNILILNQARDMMVVATEQVARQNLVALLKYSLIVVASAPIIALYPFAQKHFIKGVMIGSLKG